MKLPPQPSRVLALLIERSGQIVSREEIRRCVWGDETFVDFEAGLHYCLTRIRNALGDNARAPRYIETLPKRGYRFVAPVTEQREASALAVLPFANLNHDPSFDYFADGVTDVLITELGSLGQLRVISRQSTLRFRGCTTPIEEIARMLGVHLVVEGAVLRDGERVRVTAQLVQAAPEHHLWARSYDCAASDVLGLQRQLASSIVAEVNRAIRGETHEPGACAPRARAHEEYLKGRFCGAAWTGDGLTGAVRHFQRAVELDPAFALAHAGLAHSYALLGYWNHLPPGEALALAKAAALQALALDDTLSEAHAALSWVLLWQDWDVAGSQREQARAIALNPSNETVRIQHALDAAGMLQEREIALAEMETALRLDPLSAFTGSAAAWILFFVREYERAVRQATATLEMHPMALHSCYVLGLAEMMLARPDAAIQALERAVEISPVPLSFAYLGRALAAAGRPERARMFLHRLLVLPPGELTSTRPLVILYAALREMDLAFQCLEQAFEARDSLLLALHAVAIYDPLREDPRFLPFIGRVREAMGMAQPEQMAIVKPGRN